MRSLFNRIRAFFRRSREPKAIEIVIPKEDLYEALKAEHFKDKSPPQSSD